MKRFTNCAMAACVPAIVLVAMAADRAPSNAKPLTEIVGQLEHDGFGPLREVSLDDGMWEVEGYQDNQPVEFTIDPRDGKIVSKHPDEAGERPGQDDLKLSEILKGLDQLGYTQVREADLERGSWEIEAVHDRSLRELQVDAETGKVTSDRPED